MKKVPDVTISTAYNPFGVPSMLFKMIMQHCALLSQLPLESQRSGQLASLTSRLLTGHTRGKGEVFL